MNSRFALIALPITIAVLSLVLFISVVGGTASSVSGEAIAIQQEKGTRVVADNRLLAYQRPSISQGEPLTLTEPISIYLPLLSTAGYIDKSAERTALMALYTSTNGDGWYNNAGWGTDTSYCEWYGVTCDENGNVTILDMGTNKMTGTLPSEIGDLPMLTVLRLWGTYFYPKIYYGTQAPPPGDIEHYYLSEPLPPEIGNLASLQVLDLNSNRFTFLPPEIGNLGNLKELWLIDNQLSSLPSETGNLVSLQLLELGNNQLTSLPSEIGNLSSLQVLYLGYNQLSGLIPAFLSDLSSLSWLTLNENPDLTCWETKEARDWALLLENYSGPTCFVP